MQDGQSVKQQVVSRIKESTNILVTVGKNPSVDALSAALGFTLLLNKMDKHATAVFSGKIPRAIEFLEPSKTFEGTTDSLRDFIIALDKEKADHLRYKVEGDVVKIFITPYRTTITDKDLDFSQGDFNVEAVIALGVEKREDLDEAITAHGRILHDAPVVTVNNSSAASSLGTIDWQDQQASSLCEMIASITDALAPDVLDEQISTALLTGIVASTERFSNKKTTPKVMTISAQLMAAGANQQLIATKLETGRQAEAKPARSNSTDLKDGQQSTRLTSDENENEEKIVETSKKDGSLQISHEEHAAEQDDKHENLSVTEELKEAKDQAALDAAEDALASVLPQAAAVTVQPEDLAKELEEAVREEPEEIQETPAELTVEDKPSWLNDKVEQPPTLGGVLNATSEQAQQDAEQTAHDDRNRTILSHGEGDESHEKPQENVRQDAPLEEFPVLPPHEPAVQHEKVIQPPSHEPVQASEPADLPVFEPLPAAPVIENQPFVPFTPALDSNTGADDALQAVHDALNAADATNPAPQPVANLNSQPLGETINHDQYASVAPMQPTESFSTEPVSFPAPPPVPQFDMQGLPPMPPDFSTLPPVQPQAQPEPIDPFGLPPVTIPTQQTAPQPTPNDPGQFRIPGQ